MPTIVIIGSGNPSKLEAVRDGFQAVFPEQEFSFQTAEVSSEVSSQPMGDQETLTGARNRAKNSRAVIPDADYWVGLEGGLAPLENDGESLAAFSWAYVLGENNTGFARSASYILSNKITVLIQQGLEQGEADDLVFGLHNSKQNIGGVGLLTKDLITRSELYSMAVKLALIPFIQPQLYPATIGSER
jgi:inosine/xanthosine triphosphatase